MARIFLGMMALLCISLLSTINHPLKEDSTVQLAILAIRAQAGLPEETEIKLVEKRESPLPDFYMVKLLVPEKDKEVPLVVYVDRSPKKFSSEAFSTGVKTSPSKKQATPDSRRLDQDLSNPGKPLFLIDSLAFNLWKVSGRRS